MDNDFENSTSESNRKDKLILELKEIIQEYESRLNSKDKNFQLQFSELQNELFTKEIDLVEINKEKCKMESQLIDLQELVEENKLVIQSKDLSLQVIQEDLKAQLETVRNHYIETLSIRQEEIEMLRSTGSQLREQLALRENDMIQLMQRHENQIINLFNETNTKHEQSDMDRMVNAMKDQITDIRGVLIEKQELLKMTNKRLEEQDQLVRQLQERNLNLEQETKKNEQMKHTEQAYENHIKQLNANIKDNKKKQLTSKAKTKSLEKQLTSLQDHLMKKEEKENELKNELVIRDKIIEKQNILIEELRQTEYNLRQSLNHSIAVQEEQILELKYWEHYHKLVPDFEKCCNDESFTTDPLKMAIESLEQLSVSKGERVEDEIKVIIEQLSSYRTSFDDRNKYIIHLENQCNLLSNCISKINKLNINLNKHIGVLVHDYQQCHTLFIDINDEIKDTQELESLDQCTTSELIRKLIISTNQACSYNDQLSFLENENLRTNLELNKIVETCCEMSSNIEITFQNIKASLNMTITNVNGNNLITKDVCASSCIESFFLRILEENKLIQLEIENNISKLNLENMKISESVRKHINDLDFEIVKMKNLSNNTIDKVNKTQISKIDMGIKQIIINQEIINEIKVMNSDNQILVGTEGNYTRDSYDADLKPIEDGAMKMEKVIFEKESTENQSLIESLNNQLVNLQMIVNELNVKETKFKEELENNLKITENTANELQKMAIKISILEENKKENESFTNTLNSELIILKNVMEELGMTEKNNKGLVMVTEGKEKIIQEFGNVMSIIVAMNMDKDEKDLIITELNNQLSKLSSSREAICIREAKCQEDLTSVIEDRENILNELENIKSSMTLLREEKSESESIINDLKKQIINLQAIIHNVNDSEINSKDELIIMKEENKILLKDMEDVKSSILIFEKEREEKISLITELNNKISAFNNVIDEISQRETNCKEKLANVIKDRENISKELDNTKNTVVQLDGEKLEKDWIINDLQNQIIHLNANEINSKNELEIIKAENKNLLKDIEDLKNSIVICEKETEEKIPLITELNNKLSTLNNVMAELSITEMNCKENLANVTEDRENIRKELENTKNVVVLLNEEKSEMISIINGLKNQIIDLDVNEINLQEEMKIVKEENKNLLQHIEDVKNSIVICEKEREEKVSLIIALNNELSTLNNAIEEIREQEKISKDDLISVTEERGNILKELGTIRGTILVMDEEKDKNNMIINELNNKLSLLNSALEQMSLNETIYKDDLAAVIEDRNNIGQELENIKSNIVTMNIQSDEKTSIICDLNDRVSRLNNIIEEMDMREKTYKDDLSTVIDDRDNSMKKLDNLTSTVIIMEKEMNEKDLIINDLNCQVLKLNDAIGEQDLTYKDNLATVTENRENLVKELENMKTILVALEKEKDEKDFVINKLNDQLTTLSNTMEQLSMKETNSKHDLAIVAENRENLMKEFENMKSVVALLEGEKSEKDSIINDLKNQISDLKVIFHDLNTSEKQSKEELQIMKEQNENLLKELEYVKSSISILEKERDEKVFLITELNNKSTMLNNVIEDLSSKEINYIKDLANVTEDQENLMKELENMRSDIVANDIEKDNKDSIINELNNELSKLKNIEKDMHVRESIYKDNLVIINGDRESIMKELENSMITIVAMDKEIANKNVLINKIENEMIELKQVLQNTKDNEINYQGEMEIMKEEKSNLSKERDEKDSLINELKNKLSTLNNLLKEMESNEINYKNDLATGVEDRKTITKELENTKSIVVVMEKEKQENDSVIYEMNDKLSKLNNALEESDIKEINYKEHLIMIAEDRERMMKDLENMKSFVIEINKEKDEKDEIINELNDQLSLLNKDSGEISSKEKETILHELEMGKSLIVSLTEKQEIVANELYVTRENLNALNLENSNNLSLINETKIRNEKLLLELNEKKKKIDEIEKACLVLKAKLIKLKNQSDQKINILTAERDELLEKLIAKEKILDPVFPSKSYDLCVSEADLENKTYISNLKIANFDEKSLFNQIEHLSDQVDAKVRKMNYEIEEFLEHNEKVTSSLISKTSPNHQSSCNDAQCKRLALKIRELSNNNKNLQDQNQLMKNKMLDLYKYLENEQEIHKQVSEEDCRLNNELAVKLNLCTDENVQLHGQITHFEKELKGLKQEKLRNVNKIATLKSELSNMSSKHSNLSIEYTNLLENFQSIRSKIDLEYSSKLEQIQSDLILSESINVQNAKKISDLENDRFELRKINKKLSHENSEIRQSLQLLIDRECDKCKTHKKEIDLLNTRITDLIGINDNNLIKIGILKDTVKHLEEYIKTNKLTETNHHFLESILSMMNDLNLFISNWKVEGISINFHNRYDHLFETNEIIKTRMQDCLSRAECINSITNDLLSERNDLREKVRNLEITETNVWNQLHSLEIESLALNKTILDYQSMLIIEREKTTRLENCLISTNELIRDYEIQLKHIRETSHESTFETTDCPIVKEFTAVESTSAEVEVSEQLKDNYILAERNIQQYVLNRLSNYFSLELTSVDGKIDNDFKETFEKYMKIIEEITIGQLSANTRVDRCIQTSVDFIYLKKVECDISNSIKEWTHLPEVSLVNDSSNVGWIINPEAYINAVTTLHHQIVKLENDLQIEEQRKYEISDRFEQIIMELETACDAEVEKLKLTNDLLRQQIQSLQTLREEQDRNLNCLRSQILELQLELSKSGPVCEKDKLVDAIVDTSDNPLSWISNLNDALKETISEKEDQITELMKQYNESTNKIKEARLKEESHCLEIEDLTNKIEIVSAELKNKENSLKEGFDVINELEVMCVEKDNRINSLEKDLAEINTQMEQYISALCSMQARLEASKPNIESMINRMDNRSNSLQLLNLIDQLEKDYAAELEQSEMAKSKLEIKLNKAIQIIHKLKKQLKQSHIHVWKLHDEIKGLKSFDCAHDGSNETNVNETDSKATATSEGGTSVIDVSTQIDFEDDTAIFKEENANFKGIIENLHVNNFILWRELDNIRKCDRNVRGSSLPPGISNSKVVGKGFGVESERSLSPVSQISSNSIEGDSVNLNQVKDLQRKLHRTTQQLNQMRVERNRIHQEYTRIRQLKEEGDTKILDLLKHIDANVNQNSILHEKDQLVEINNKYSAKVVELQAEVDMTTVRNSILETKCKKMEWKLNNQRRKYDLLVLKLDEKEQEIDRCSDEIRRNNSAFEKERLELLREKRELKLSNKNKDEKISNFRKRLSMKTKEACEKNEKEKSPEDSTENDYLFEIEQMRGELNQQKLESKRCLIQHREEIIKYKGQIEELIDDNRQLKRKLSFDQQESKLNFIEMSPTNRYPGGSLMQKIDEAVESLDYSIVRNSTDSSTVLAKVVLEKEQLIQQLLEKEEQLNNEKRISEEYHKQVIKLSDIRERQIDYSIDSENKIIETVEQRNAIRYSELIDKSIQVMIYNTNNPSSNNRLVELFDTPAHMNASNSSTDIIVFSQRECVDKSVQTSELYEHFITDNYITLSNKNVDKETQTIAIFSKCVINEYRQMQLSRLEFRKSVEIECQQAIIFHNTHTQTDDTTEYREYLLRLSEPNLHSVANQTDFDPLVNTLQNEIIEKGRSLDQVNSMLSLERHKIIQMESELNEAGKDISRLEVKGLEYMEIIGKLELETIEIDRKYKQEITELKCEMNNFEKLNEKKELVDESSQINESEFKDGLRNDDLKNRDNEECTGYMEEQKINKLMLQPGNAPSCFFAELERILNLYPDNSSFQEIRTLMSSQLFTDCDVEFERQPPFNNPNIANLIPILREEIVQLKQSLNEKNHEIGQLKCLRNQLQSELLESGQQIKESNMEFLNLKESIQAISVEKDILSQKREDLEMRFKQLVHFNRMISLDLRRLRNPSPLSEEFLSGNIFDEENVINVTQSLEHELHKLLEQICEKDVKLGKAINQFEQMPSHPDSDTVSSNYMNQFKSQDPNDGSPSTANDHEECQHLFAEVSELLDERQVEIEELKKYKMRQEYLSINKEEIPSWRSLNETVAGNSNKNHSKLLIESEDGQFSDNDYQTVVSPDGSTIIRVERIARVQNSCQHRLFNRVSAQLKCKVFNRLKAAAFTGGTRIFTFRSQPRLNIKTLLTIYMIFIHFLLLRCSLL